MQTDMTILVIDDETLSREGTLRMLEPLGYTLLQATSGAKGIELTRQHQPDMIVLDVMMPEIDGFDVCRQIRSDPRCGDPFIVFLSAYQISSESHVEGLETGADGYIARPIANREFLARIETFVRLKQTQKHLKKTQQKLKQANRQLEGEKAALKHAAMEWRTTFDAMNEAICLFDVEGKILRCNQAAATLLNKSFDEIIGRSCCEFLRGRISPFEGCPFVTMLQSHRRETGTFALHETWLKVTADPVFNEEQELVGAVCIMTDITARKQVKDELAAYRHHLEELVEERTTQLSEAKELAERANQAKTEFLANMSHDLRTPLNAVLGFAQLLHEADNLTARQKDNIDVILKSGEYLLKLVNDILDLSKIEADKVELSAETVHLPNLLRLLADMMRVRASQKGLEFLYEPDPELPQLVSVDEKRLREVLLNLLGNAIKFTETGSVTLRVSVINHDQLSIVNCQLRFEVEDSGIGIDSTLFDEIFHPFRQAGDSRYRAQGTGLGLAISQKLVSLMGGELKVKSILGVGSTFWFEIPLPLAEDDATHELSVHQEIAGYRGARRTLLVADDQPENRMVLMSFLVPLGFELIEAENGRQCLAKWSRFHPDLILLDLIMPEMSGLAVARHIRETEAALQAAGHTFPRTVLITISANAFEATRQECIESGCDDFLSKPFQLNDLLEQLQKYLELEWIYKEHLEAHQEGDALGEKSTVSAADLPPDARAVLLEQAVRGDVNGLLKELDTLEESLEEEFRPVFAHLRIMAKSFQVDDIADMLETMGEE